MLPYKRKRSEQFNSNKKPRITQTTLKSDSDDPDYQYISESDQQSSQQSSQQSETPKDTLMEMNNTSVGQLVKIVIMRSLLDQIERASDSDSETDTDTDLETESEITELIEEDFEYHRIEQKIETLDDLIKLGESYNEDDKKRYNLDIRRLSQLVDPLKKLRDVIGMTSIKKNIINHILFFLQGLQDNNLDIINIVITGPPGVGKTLLGNILGDIYYNMGVIKGNSILSKRELEDLKYKNYYNPNREYVFRVAKRSDLIGQYLGHTAIKTQEVIDSCKGGVLFIDEVYSLGNSKVDDYFSKECIDTINQNLTEKKGEFLCIIAGYKNDVENCFFAYNQGLKRRFPFNYNIDNYTPQQLLEIFIKGIKDINWELCEEIPVSLFENNIKYFPNFGGDIENLLHHCKVEHSLRILYDDENCKKKLNKSDILNGFKAFKEHKESIKENMEELTASEIKTKFIDLINKEGWKIENIDDISTEFFTNHDIFFKYFKIDLKDLLNCCKIEQVKRTNNNSKILTKIDIDNGFLRFKQLDVIVKENEYNDNKKYLNRTSNHQTIYL